MKTQGGTARAKEDAAVEAAMVRGQGGPTAAGTASTDA
jgi:hypothetical protein